MGDVEQFVLGRNPLLAGAVNRIRQDVDLVTVRVNYQLGGYGPVVAKY